MKVPRLHWIAGRRRFFLIDVSNCTARVILEFHKAYSCEAHCPELSFAQQPADGVSCSYQIRDIATNRPASYELAKFSTLFPAQEGLHESLACKTLSLQFCPGHRWRRCRCHTISMQQLTTVAHGGRVEIEIDVSGLADGEAPRCVRST